MNKKVFTLFTFLPLLFSITGCNKNIESEPEVKGYYTEGRDVQFIKGEKPTYKCFNETYTNGNYPLGKGGSGQYTSEIADPHIVRGDDGMFYIFATNRIVLKSEDGCNWEIHSTSIINMPTWGDNYAKKRYGSVELGVWAPDVMKIGDKWIYYYSLSGWAKPVGIGYAIADDAGGPYIDCGELFIGSDLGIASCIDPCLFREGNKLYMVAGSASGCYLIRLNEDGMSLYDNNGEIEDPLAYARDNKVLVCGSGEDLNHLDDSMYEGTYLMKHGDYYYLFGSSGTCCAKNSSTYRVYVGRSKNIEGPYSGKDHVAMTLSGDGTTYGEIVIESDSGNDKNIAGPGHHSILVDDNGEWWMYYHAYIKKDKYATRHLMIDKINWDDDGFPVIGNNEDGDNKKGTYLEELDGPALRE